MRKGRCYSWKPSLQEQEAWMRDTQLLPQKTILWWQPKIPSQQGDTGGSFTSSCDQPWVRTTWMDKDSNKYNLNTLPHPLLNNFDSHGPDTHFSWLWLRYKHKRSTNTKPECNRREWFTEETEKPLTTRWIIPWVLMTFCSNLNLLGLHFHIQWFTSAHMFICGHSGETQWKLNNPDLMASLRRSETPQHLC